MHFTNGPGLSDTGGEKSIDSNTNKIQAFNAVMHTTNDIHLCSEIVKSIRKEMSYHGILPLIHRGPGLSDELRRKNLGLHCATRKKRKIDRLMCKTIRTTTAKQHSPGDQKNQKSGRKKCQPRGPKTRSKIRTQNGTCEDKKSLRGPQNGASKWTHFGGPKLAPLNQFFEIHMHRKTEIKVRFANGKAQMSLVCFSWRLT